MDRDSALEALKKELEIVEVEKKWLADKVAGLCASHIDLIFKGEGGVSEQGPGRH